jgi:hypothetical protein
MAALLPDYQNDFNRWMKGFEEIFGPISYADATNHLKYHINFGLSGLDKSVLEERMEELQKILDKFPDAMRPELQKIFESHKVGVLKQDTLPTDTELYHLISAGHEIYDKAEKILSPNKPRIKEEEHKEEAPFHPLGEEPAPPAYDANEEPPPYEQIAEQPQVQKLAQKKQDRRPIDIAKSLYQNLVNYKINNEQKNYFEAFEADCEALQQSDLPEWNKKKIEQFANYCFQSIVYSSNDTVEEINSDKSVQENYSTLQRLCTLL